MEAALGSTPLNRRGGSKPPAAAQPHLTQQSASMNDIRQKLLSSWLPPGGSCHDEISASRNRYFIVTDEGRRWLKVIDCSAEWWKPKHIPFIQLHSLTNLSPPLISLFYQPVPKCRLIKNPASPRGKPRGRNRKRFITNAPRCPGSLGSPSWRPLQWQCKTRSAHHSMNRPVASASGRFYNFFFKK